MVGSNLHIREILPIVTFINHVPKGGGKGSKRDKHLQIGVQKVGSIVASVKKGSSEIELSAISRVI